MRTNSCHCGHSSGFIHSQHLLTLKLRDSAKISSEALLTHLEQITKSPALLQDQRTPIATKCHNSTDFPGALCLMLNVFLHKIFNVNESNVNHNPLNFTFTYPIQLKLEHCSFLHTLPPVQCFFQGCHW